MSVAHFVVQSKGGVGKSFCAAMLLQYLAFKNKPVAGFDTDPSNHSLSGFASLHPQLVELKNSRGSRIDVRQFEDLLRYLAVMKDRDSVIDVGANSFIPLKAFVAEHNEMAVTAMKKQDVKIVFHMPISSGKPRDECIKCIAEVLTDCPNIITVAWINNFPDQVYPLAGEFHNAAEQLNSLNDQKLGDRLAATVNLPWYGESELDASMFRWVLDHGLTFNDIAASSRGEEEAAKIMIDQRPLSMLDYMRVDQIRQDYYDAMSDLDAIAV